MMEFSSIPLRGRHTVVGIVTEYELEDGGVGVQVPLGTKNFTYPYRPDRL
jgi:hypothetical protein